MGAFLEPFGIFIATFVVWAYSTSVQFARQQGEATAQATTNAEGSGISLTSQFSPATTPTVTLDAHPDEDPEPSFLDLDRPCDDEVVQTYVRLGHKMSDTFQEWETSATRVRQTNFCGRASKYLSGKRREILRKPRRS